MCWVRSGLFLTMLCLPFAMQAHEPIVLHYTLRPPYTIENRQAQTLGGVAGERVTTILQRAKIPFTLHLSAPLRQLDIVRDNKARDCTFDWYKTSERERFARFSQPFAQDSPYVYVVRKDISVSSPITLAAILNSGLTMVLIEGYSYGAEIDAQLRSGKLASVYAHGDSLKLLTTVRRKGADFGLLLADEVRVLLHENDLLRAELRVYPTAEMPPPSFTYFLCSHKVDDETMQAFNKAMATMPFVQYQ